MLADTNVTVRGVALLSLGKVGGPAAAQAVHDLLTREKDEDLRTAASAVLQALEADGP